MSIEESQRVRMNREVGTHKKLKLCGVEFDLIREEHVGINLVRILGATTYPEINVGTRKLEALAYTFNMAVIMPRISNALIMRFGSIEKGFEYYRFTALFTNDDIDIYITMRKLEPKYYSPPYPDYECAETQNANLDYVKGVFNSKKALENEIDRVSDFEHRIRIYGSMLAKNISEMDGNSSYPNATQEKVDEYFTTCQVIADGIATVSLEFKRYCDARIFFEIDQDDFLPEEKADE